MSDDEDEKLMTFGELKLSDLPPVEDLKISVPADSLVKVGKVVSIVGVLAVIESIKSMPPLDLDTVLFKKDGQPIGQIFDVFGAVTEPHYSVRFTNVEQLENKCITTDLEVYFLPQSDRTITKFAFVNELRKIKGTDASGEHDNEIPQSATKDSNDDDDDEFSNDEEERRAKRRV